MGLTVQGLIITALASLAPKGRNHCAQVLKSFCWHFIGQSKSVAWGPCHLAAGWKEGWKYLDTALRGTRSFGRSNNCGHSFLPCVQFDGYGHLTAGKALYLSLVSMKVIFTELQAVSPSLLPGHSLPELMIAGAVSQWWNCPFCRFCWNQGS